MNFGNILFYLCVSNCLKHDDLARHHPHARNNIIAIRSMKMTIVVITLISTQGNSIKHDSVVTIQNSNPMHFQVNVHHEKELKVVTVSAAIFQISSRNYLILINTLFQGIVCLPSPINMTMGSPIRRTVFTASILHYFFTYIAQTAITFTHPVNYRDFKMERDTSPFSERS